MQVDCYMGQTSVLSKTFEATYKFRPWIISINSQYLFPAFRKDHRKIIRINGKRQGYAEVRGGLRPLYKYRLRGHGLQVAIKQFLRAHLGVLVRSYEREYIYVKLCGFEYVVITSVSAQDYTHCEVYEMRWQGLIGRFIFDPTFNEVSISTTAKGVTNTLQVILGYVADVMVYNNAVTSLDKCIAIHFI